MARRATIGFLTVLAVFGLWRVLPWATEDRGRIAGSPSLSGFFSASPIEVRGGQRACVTPVPLDDDVDQVNVTVTAARPQPLTLDLRAPGYAARSTAGPDYPAGGEATVAFRLDTPPPGELLGELCVTNAGRRTVLLAGTEESRSAVSATTTVDGEQRPDMAVTFYSADRSSTLAFAGTMIDRAAALTGGMLPAPLAWLLAIAFLLGVPAGALVALTRSGYR